MQAEASPGPIGQSQPDPNRRWTTRPASPTTLAVHRSGSDSEQLPVTLVHGFAQTGRCLGPLAEALADQGAVTAVDAPGHGASLRHAAADLWAGADLLLEGPHPRVVVGYSMGGRLALHAALARPERVAALVLIGATAGVEDPQERHRRRARDEELALRLERTGLDAFLGEWLAMPMFSGLPEWARFDEERRANSVEGLAASLRNAGTGSMTPLWDRLGAITCSTLLVTGEADHAYTAIAARLAERLGGPTRRVVVAGAGHAAHLEAPEAVIGEVTDLLRRPG